MFSNLKVCVFFGRVVLKDLLYDIVGTHRGSHCDPNSIRLVWRGRFTKLKERL